MLAKLSRGLPRMLWCRAIREISPADAESKSEDGLENSCRFDGLTDLTRPGCDRAADGVSTTPPPALFVGRSPAVIGHWGSMLAEAEGSGAWVFGRGPPHAGSTANSLLSTSTGLRPFSSRVSSIWYSCGTYSRRIFSHPPQSRINHEAHPCPVQNLRNWRDDHLDPPHQSTLNFSSTIIRDFWNTPRGHQTLEPGRVGSSRMGRLLPGYFQRQLANVFRSRIWGQG
ncbi:hypothetical protein B0T16DRAFT_235092 [Cercophora newfieldiana]|uniref:Uncharacterized protein n=1 Tax=Cercophora newfieldiana TaxID=92897 RepID=A0AA39XRM9_9PEZI|nr:hypothetical protein B0T16DRAFT_235092 [Cercophora newfieldiana]